MANSRYRAAVKTLCLSACLRGRPMCHSWYRAAIDALVTHKTQKVKTKSGYDGNDVKTNELDQ